MMKESEPISPGRTPSQRGTGKSRPRLGEDSSAAPAAQAGSTGWSSPRLLIIEDNLKLAASLDRGLTEQGFTVDVAPTGQEGERALTDARYDLIVLDLMLPDRDGVEICRTLRESHDRTPILILSALSATKDKVAGLDSGADDYLTKPFEFDELLSRIRAMLRRRTTAEIAPIRFADLELDLAQRTATRSGTTIPLTNKEFALLEFLMRRAGTVLTRTQIGEAVWAVNFDPTSNVIDVYVSMVRRKIDKGFERPLIHTIVGTGYVFGDPP